MTMIEKVARAIATAQWGKENATDAAWRDLPDIFPAARAAIAAMREPTESMIEASNREWDGRMSYRSSGAWQAMIDIALSDAGS